jgi:hypothetical protein
MLSKSRCVMETCLDCFSPSPVLVVALALAWSVVALEDDIPKVLEADIPKVLEGITTPLPENTLVNIPAVTVAAAFRHELSLELPTVSKSSTPELPSASVIATGIEN